MTFYDEIKSVGRARLTKDGYLAASALAARTGIQEYSASELGMEGDQVYRIYRPEDEVFKKDTMDTFAHRPLTIDHPPESVTADNWKDYAVGYTGDEVVRDGDYVRVPLLLTDADAIQAYKKGKRELSMGYDCDIEFIKGVTDSGESYDAIQRNIRNNHISIVQHGRAGSDVRIGDNRNLKSSIKENMKTLLIDGISVEFNEQGAQAIEKLQKQIADAEIKMKESIESSAKALADSEAELAKRDAEIEELKGKIMDAATLDAEIASRVQLISDAKKIADIDYSGKNRDEIILAAVKAKLGDAAIKDKSEAYVQARFDILIEDAGKGKDTHTRGANLKVVDDGQTAYEERIRNAWKRKEVK